MISPEVLQVHAHDGATLMLRRYPSPSRLRLILSHGNGLAMDGYRSCLKLLSASYELVLFDLRNHGTSGATPVAGHTIRAMGEDHVAVAAECRNAFDRRQTFGVFHSISAIAAVLAGQDDAGWDGVVLIDPPLVSLDAATGLVRSTNDKLANFARNRQSRFGSATDLANTMVAGVARSWVAGAALDMAQAITRPHPHGGVELMCAGEYEAKIYDENRTIDSYAALGALKPPVAILGADADAPRAPYTAHISRAAAQCFKIPYAAVAQAGHMLQLEKPEAAATALHNLLRKLMSA